MKSLFLLLFLCIFVSHGEATGFIYHIVPNNMTAKGFSFRVETKRNANGSVHFIVRISDVSGHFEKLSEIFLSTVVERGDNFRSSPWKTLKALVDGNSATCVFDAPDDSRLSFLFQSQSDGGPSGDVFCINLMDFIPR